MIPVLVALVVFQATAPPPDTAAPPDTAVLRVGTRAVVTFRGTLGAATAAERATAASRRISEAIAAGIDSVSTRTTPGGVLVQLGARPVFVITSSDVDTVTGESVASQTEAVARRLATAVQEVEEAGSLRAILVALVLALLATALLVLSIRLLIGGRRKADARLARVDVAKWPGLSIRGFTLLRPTQFVVAARAIVTVVTWTIGVIAGYLYVTFVLTQFPWTRPWGQALGHYLVSTLARLALGALSAIPGLFTVALIFLATRFLVRLVASLFQAAERGIVVLPGVHPETAEPTRRIITALMWMFALIVAYPYLPGSGSAAFKGVSVFGGLLLTLGSAGVVGQAMAGLVLMYARGFKVGDYVQTGQTQGTVVALGLLSTRIRTPKNEYVTLPNGVVVGGAITNFSAPQDFAHNLTIYSSITIGYDVPWRHVHDLMISGAKATEGVLAEPAPFVLQRALNDWYVEYQVNAAIDPKRASELPAFYSRLHGSIQDAFWAAGVEILSPSYFAVRDGNTSTVPPEQRPKGSAPSFRVDVNPGT
jgi:small-conductance mechanosensitive channel